MNIQYSTQKSRACIFINFDSEEEEQRFIKCLAGNMDKKCRTHVYIKDLDVDIPLYERYFNCEYLLAYDNTPSPVILASDLDNQTLDNIIGNWGFYTFEACLVWTKESGLAAEELLKIGEKSFSDKLELVIYQVPDCSLNIVVNDYFFDICKTIIDEW